MGCPQVSLSELSPHACTWTTVPSSYRQMQERAYTNHTGATLTSICALMLVYPATLCFQMCAAGAATRRLSPLLAKVVEMLAAMLPLTCTFSCPHLVWQSLASMLIVTAPLTVCGFEALSLPRNFTRIRATLAARKEATTILSFSRIGPEPGRLRFIAEYRAMIMITTCIAILAVDFASIFPRQHAKTETFGYSLMDLGTGCIICSSAVCSRSARGLTNEKRVSSILRTIVSLWPVLTIGFIRFFLLWGIDYHVPTSEYGTHWNFFFTIALVSLFATAADLTPIRSGIAGTLLLLAYQLFLSIGGGEYIISAPREGPFSANREGVLGSMGFLGIHWLSVALGGLVMDVSCSARSIVQRVLLVAGASLASVAILDAAGLPPSRRMCNLSYSVLIIGVNALVLGTLGLVDLCWLLPRPPVAPAYGGVQDSMLVAFLIANLLTGAVNVASQPLLVPCWAAMLVMMVYCLVWALPFSVLHSRSIALKFW